MFGFVIVAVRTGKLLQKVRIKFPVNSSKPRYLFSLVICRTCKLKMSKDVSGFVLAAAVECFLFAMSFSKHFKSGYFPLFIK